VAPATFDSLEILVVRTAPFHDGLLLDLLRGELLER
jgi:hypothetical protein